MSDGLAAVTKVDHVGLVVPSIAEALPLFRDALGGQFISGGDNDETGMRLVHLRLPGFKIELLESLRPDSVLARHLERQGPGFHHITFFVDDVARTITNLEGAGYQLGGTDLANPRWRETFMTPKSAFGALLQFADTTLDWDKEVTDFTVDDVLAGRVVWDDLVPCLRAGPA